MLHFTALYISGCMPAVMPGGALDERCAAAGLCVKLHVHQIPDLWSIAVALEQVVSAVDGKPDEEQCCALTRAFLLLRAVRGQAGTSWLQPQLTSPSLLGKLASPADDAEVLRELAADLLLLHDSETESRGHAPNWAAHQEGRHARFSGRRALAAMADPAGAQNAAEACEALKPMVQKLVPSGLKPCEVGFEPCVFDDTDWVLMLTACRHKVPLCKDQGGMYYMDSYNSTNAGFALATWAAMSGRGDVRKAFFSPKVIGIVLKSQGKNSRAKLKKQGLDSAAACESKFERLQALAAEWRDRVHPLLAGGFQPSSGVLPFCLFVHLCEWGQCVNALGHRRIAHLLAAERGKYEEGVSAVVSSLASLSPPGKGSSQCHTLQVFVAALEALHRWPLGGKRLRAVAKPAGGTKSQRRAGEAGVAAKAQAKAKAKAEAQAFWVEVGVKAKAQAKAKAQTTTKTVSRMRCKNTGGGFGSWEGEGFE